MQNLSGYNKYYYDRIAKDNKLCDILLKQHQIDIIMAETYLGVPESCRKELGGNRFNMVIDLESFMVVDYSSFPELSDTQKELITSACNYHDQKIWETIFSGIRNTFVMSWNEPNSNNMLKAMQEHEISLAKTLAAASGKMAENFDKTKKLLPYWMRFSQLRLLSHIPNKIIKESSLHNIAFFPIKKRGMNATSANKDGIRFITANYALRDVLFEFNRQLEHFYSTTHMSHRPRAYRAINHFIPLVIYLCTNVECIAYIPPTILFNDSVKRVKFITECQIDFILMHEIAHHILEHPQKSVIISDIESKKKKKIGFEVEADALANYLLAVNNIEGVEPALYNEDSYVNYNEIVEGVEVLFEHMHFCEQMSDLIRDDFGSYVRIATLKDGVHPPAMERLKIFLSPINKNTWKQSKLSMYARDFYTEIISYYKGMSISDKTEMLKVFFS
ncbi:hypothetical protein EFV10_03475 [Escherichia coli]|uniref:hypothetical protein n=1 Tax=Escherichia coli TaxID=562 RepID=UPI0006A5F652|nr:hypothetical protein [Escherichia coli]EFA4178467.1 hypothetical protein [Escherichia coli O43:H14]EEU0313205.1 hypothetical protein [Escherichia coli]EEW0266152.1 hypothetical protein [Escherichia coli]EEW6579820.1 hypothetical protein [Escherichia coli]EEX4504799.1 hypothetical protein [Escherichia coli]